MKVAGNRKDILCRNERWGRSWKVSSVLYYLWSKIKNKKKQCDNRFAKKQRLWGYISLNFIQSWGILQQWLHACHSRDFIYAVALQRAFTKAEAQTCSSMTMFLYLKWASWRHALEKPEGPAQSPDLYPTEHRWDDLEHRLHFRPPHLTLVPDLTNALVSDWRQIPTAAPQDLVEREKRLKVIIPAKKD